MNERLPSVCLVRFAGLFTYQVGAAGSAGDRFPNPDGADDQMAAAGRGAGRAAVVARRVRIALEDLVGQNERLRIAGPAAGAIGPGRAGGGAVAGAAIEVAAVVALPEPRLDPVPTGSMRA